MITQVTFNDFINAFRSHNAEAVFSYAGLQALFDYASEWQDGNGGPWVLDVIELCCDFTEYKTAIEVAKDYGHNDFSESEALDFLRDNTIVLEFNGGVIVADF